MPREILPVNPAAEALHLNATAKIQTTPQPAQADLSLDKDALAGALPAWDLLPASPFIRRVK